MTNAVFISLSVHWKITRAQMLGACIYRAPQDCGWMYHHCFADLDGHQCELSCTWTLIN